MNIAVLVDVPVFGLFPFRSKHGHWTQGRQYDCSYSHGSVSVITLREEAVLPIIGWIGHRPIGGDYIYPEDYYFSLGRKNYSGNSPHILSGPYR